MEADKKFNISKYGEYDLASLEHHQTSSSRSNLTIDKL